MVVRVRTEQSYKEDVKGKCEQKENKAKGRKTAQSKATKGTLVSGRRAEESRQKRDEETEDIYLNEDVIKFVYFFLS